MIQQTLKQWFWDCYDHLVALFVGNVLMFALAFGGGFLVVQFSAPFIATLPGGFQVLAGLTMAILFLSIVCATWFSATGHFGALVAREKYPAFRELLRGIASDFLLQWKYTVVCITGVCVFLVNIWFYSFSGMMQAPPFLLHVLSGLCFWMIVLILASMVVGLPLRSRERAGVKATIKRSFLMLLRHPISVIGLFIFIASLWIIAMWLRFAPIFLFGFSGTAMLLNSFHDVMFGEDFSAKQAAREQEGAAATSWKERQEHESEAEQARMSRSRYERTFRDLLRPWES